MNSIFEKIKKIEALIEKAGSEGEKQAALLAKQRLEQKNICKELEYTIHTRDMWHKKLFMALCRKYNLEPYRYYRQKYTTVMVKINKKFLDDIVWKEYLEYSKILENLVDEVTLNVISKIHEDKEETIIAGDLEYKSD